MDKFITKAKIWFFCLLWLLLTFLVTACLSFICETIIDKVNGFESTMPLYWFYITIGIFFQSHFIPSLIAITLLILVTRFPLLSSIKVPKLLFGVILTLNVFITSFHIDFIFHKLLKPLLLRNAVLFFIVMSLSLNVLSKVGQTYLMRLSAPKPRI